jgi:hypothetical protein
MISTIKYLLLLSVVFAGCGSTAPTNLAQAVGEVAWRPNESGMISLIEKTTESQYDYSTYETFSVYSIGPDGSIGQPYNTPQSQTSNGYAPTLYISNDGNSAIVELGSDIYRIDLAGNSAKNIIQNSNLLAVSPDFKYVLSTDDAYGSATKLCKLYDISSSTPRLASQFNAVGVTDARALWLENGTFALTHYDTNFYHVSIYDTAGTIVRTIPNAEAAFHASAFSPGSHDLFIRNLAEGIDKINLQTGVRTAVITQDSVGSMDASADGSLLLYSSNTLATSFNLYAVNVANRHTAQIGQKAIAIVISPNADKAAVIHYVDENNSDIQTVGVSVPQ